MRKLILMTLAALAAIAATAPAEAARHKKQPAECEFLMPCDFGTQSAKIGAFFSDSFQSQRPEPARGRRMRSAPVAPSWTLGSVREAVGRPARYIAGRLICAINVNAALAERGIRGTGSALAHSFDHWGVRVAAPVPGAVAVTDRKGGGHVAVVSRVEGGRVFVWNPSSRGRGWTEVEYTHRGARYRVAGA